MDIHPYAEIFPQMTDSEYQVLLADIHKNGVKEPIVVFEDKILDGRHRQQAVLDLNETLHLRLRLPIREFCGNRSEALKFVWSANFVRRHFTAGQKACMGVRIKRQIQETTKMGNPNHAEDGTFTIGGNISTNGECQDQAGKTRDQAGKIVGVSGKSIDKAETIEEKALDIFESVLSGELSLEKGFNVVMQRQQEEKHATMLSVPPPTGKYRCIVIDPPWPVAKIEREERPNQVAKLDYPTLTLKEIEAQSNVPVLAHESGCHVYLWVTQKYLPEGFRLFEKWKVRYECLLTWVKPTGMTPYSWMYNTEHVLFGRVGKLKIEKPGQKLSFEAPVTQHSAKPNVFYDRVLLASPGPRLEMYSRLEREGFLAWGNAVHGQI